MSTELEDVPGLPPFVDAGPVELPAAVESSPADSVEQESPAAEAPAPAPRKRGRPAGSRTRKKAAPEPAPAPAYPPGQSPDEIKALAVALAASFGVAFDLVATFRGPHWSLPEQERTQLGDVWAPALAPSLTKAGPYMPVALACIVTAGVVIPRVQQDRAVVKLPPAPAVPMAEQIVPLDAIRSIAPEPTVAAPGVAQDSTTDTPPAEVAADGSPVPIAPPRRSPASRAGRGNP